MLDMGAYGDGARWHLDLAVKRGDLALAAWCLEHGASPNAPPARDQRFPQGTLAAEAARRGQDEMVALLVRHGATPPARGDGADDFVAAVARLDVERARAVARAHPEYLASLHPLRLAAQRDRDDMAALLLDLGVSPDAVDPHTGERPLHAAASNDAVRVAELLIRRGATIDARERRFDGTPLGFAVWHGHQRAIDLLSRYSRSVFQLAFAGKADRLREVLAEDPARAAEATPDGTTPLMWLPPDEAEALAVASVLLEFGADPSRRDAGGRSAADHARRRGMEEVARLLEP
jgi:uncharacterized protein